MLSDQASPKGIVIPRQGGQCIPQGLSVYGVAGPLSQNHSLPEGLYEWDTPEGFLARYERSGDTPRSHGTHGRSVDS